MCFEPQLTGRKGRVKPCAAPPRSFITMTMDLAMMSTAERHGKLVADLASERPALGEAQVMGVGRFTPADQTSLLRHKAHMVAIADAPRLGMAENGLIDAVGAKLRFAPILGEQMARNRTPQVPEQIFVVCHSACNLSGSLRCAHFAAGRIS